LFEAESARGTDLQLTAVHNCRTSLV
jgi:hypothetical protein